MFGREDDFDIMEVIRLRLHRVARGGNVIQPGGAPVSINCSDPDSTMNKAEARTSYGTESANTLLTTSTIGVEREVRAITPIEACPVSHGLFHRGKLLS